MEKFIPYEKLSKKEKQKQNAARRGSWHGLNPVTRKPRGPKAYNRKKAQKWKDDSGSVPFVFLPAPWAWGEKDIFRRGDGPSPGRTYGFPGFIRGRRGGGSVFREPFLQPDLLKQDIVSAVQGLSAQLKLVGAAV